MSGSTVELRLGDFDISEETGFVPPTPPLACLPEYFSRWEALARNLPALIRERRIREAVQELPLLEFNEETLVSESEWRRAYVLLSFLAQAYIWVEGEEGLPDRVPAILAVPWARTAGHLGVPPTTTYASTVLYNWKLQDIHAPMDGNNVYAVTSFTGTEDESWFYMLDLLIDLVAVPGLKAITHAYQSLMDDDHESLMQDLICVQKALGSMLELLLRMYELCNPKVFFFKIRPFQAGSEGLQAFPAGIVYEGVDSKPKQYHGSSAGQDSTIHSFDIFLGAEHTGSDAEFLQAMRHYMPTKHREFLETLAHQPSVREYAKQSQNSKLIASYNGAIEALAKFRSEHVILVTRYIVNQKQHSVNPSLDMCGTGGTPFMMFLKKVRDNTLALQIH